MPGFMSHTPNYDTDGTDAAYDQTIRIKTPGSGMTIFNRYKLDRVLGRGGMGVVWLADDLKLERPVALKFLPSLIGLDPAAVKELKTETRRGLDLSHPNIVRIYDFVDDEDAAAISMEFVDGKTLSELRMNTESGVFTMEEVSRWLPGVCDALDYAHFQRKVVHRDLKPANIMVTTKEAVAKIADFGIARSLSDTMSRLSAAHIGTSGTLPYMSPQQAMGERPLPTDDVYSLGATLYELLSGKPPFYRGDLSTQISSKVPPSIAERRAELEVKTKDNIPKLWEDAIAACLHKDPHMRPSCAGALAEMLGLKPSTMNARTMQTLDRNTTAKPAGGKTPLLIAAAVVILGGSAAWYFTSGKTVPTQNAVDLSSKPAPTQPEAPATSVQAEAKEAPTLAAPPLTPQPATAALAASVPTVNAALAATQPPAPASATAPGPMPLVPDPVAALATATQPPAPASAVPLPRGFVPQPDQIAAVTTQPILADPPAGFWNIEQMYPTPPFAAYSATGKKYLLYRTQSVLKEKGLYTSTVDGKEGKGTHNAIQLFQAKSSLKPTGLLDVPTLVALQLSTEADNSTWVPPTVPPSASGSKSSVRRAPAGGRYSKQEAEEPSFFERAGEKVKSIFD